MNIKKNSAILRIVAMFLVFALTLPVGAQAAVVETVQPRASDYLDSYNAYIYPAGGGKIQVWFTVTGTRTLEALGALTIQVYESTNNSNWNLVKAYSHKYNPGMMGYDDFYHSGHVDYQGVAGRYYRAYVSIWGGGMTVGDNRYFYTSSKLAT